MNEAILAVHLTEAPRKSEGFIEARAEVRPNQGDPSPVLIKALSDRKTGQFLESQNKDAALVVAGLFGIDRGGNAIVSPRNISPAAPGAYLNLVYLSGNAGVDGNPSRSGRSASVLLVVNQTADISYGFSVVGASEDRIKKILDIRKGARVEVTGSLSGRWSEEKKRWYYDILALSVRALNRRAPAATDGKLSGAIEATEPDMDEVDFL